MNRIEITFELSNSTKSMSLNTPIHHYPALNALDSALLYTSEYHLHPADLNYQVAGFHTLGLLYPFLRIQSEAYL